MLALANFIVNSPVILLFFFYPNSFDFISYNFKTIFYLEIVFGMIIVALPNFLSFDKTLLLVSCITSKVTWV